MRKELMADIKNRSELAAERPTLGNTLGRYLKRIGMEQQELAAALNVSDAVVSNWRTDKRRPTRGNLWQIAEVLAQAAGSGGRSTDRLDAASILLALLHAGDYETGTDDEGYDVVFESYRRSMMNAVVPSEGPVLRVGWVKVPPYMASGDKDEVEQSICGRIADRVIRELGAEPQYEEVRWNALIPGLNTGRFDLIAPFMMRVPTRLSSVLFSNGIGILCGYRILFPKRYAHFRKEGKDGKYLPEEKMRVMPITGETGKLFCRFRPKARLIFAAELGGDEEMTSIDDAVEKLCDLRFEGEEGVPCLITEIVTCERFVKQYKDTLASADLPIPMYYPLAFAVHRKESRLCDLLNVAIQNLRDTGTLHKWFAELLPDFTDITTRPDAVLLNSDMPCAPVGLAEWLEMKGQND